MTKRAERIRGAVQKAERDYRDSVLSTWQSQTPSVYHGFDLENDLYEDHWGGHLNRGAVSKLKRYLKKPSKFLILKGTKGLGKSTLAYTLSRELLTWHSMESAHYRSMPTLFDEFSFRDFDEASPIKIASRVDLLVIDDIGAAGEQATAHQKRCLWSVIDNRWGSGKPTIMTTNMSVTSTESGQGLIDWFGVSAWDRIQDDRLIVEFSGESFREI